MKRILPRHLEPGDSVMVVAPGGQPDPLFLERGVETLRALGLVVQVGRHALDRYGHFAGADQDRATDLMEAFTNPRIAGIFCARGGSGCARIVPYLCTDTIRANPRIFVGYSDVTILHLLIDRTAGWPTFYGPMVSTELGTGMPDACLKQMWRILSETQPTAFLSCGSMPNTVRSLIPGVAEGVLTGGTLCLVDSSIGTAYSVNTLNRILILEDFHEDAWRIDRMLTHLAHSGHLSSCTGFAIGSLIEKGESSGSDGALPIEQSLKDHLGAMGKPVLYGLPFGHIDAPLTIPLGVRARVDSNACTLEVLEPAVTD